MVRRAATATLSCALLLTSCDKVVRIGTRLPEPSSPDGGSGDAPTNSETGGDPSGTTGGAASSPGGSPATAEPDAGTEPDLINVVEQPEQAGAAAAPNTDCSSAVDATPRWSFSADTQGWQLSNPDAATLTWSDAQGMPAPGALLVAGDKPPGDDLFVFVPIPVPDLSGAVVTFNVLVERGGDLHVKLFAQSGDSYSWADGGVVEIAAGEWTCVAFDIEAPAYRTSGFDPARVRRLGVGISGTDFRILLDELSY